MDPRTQQELIALLPRLRRFARGLTGNAAEADDLVQGACERAIRSIDQWAPGTRLDSWMFRITQTTWIDTVRSRRSYDDAKATIAFEDRSEAGPDSEAEDRMTLKEVQRAVARLPEEQRSVLMLVCVEGLSYKEASDAIGVPAGTVMSRLARARKALRDLLGENEGVAGLTGSIARA